jgi:hypothetical protein
MKILNIDQRSDEWFIDRLGKITGSKLDDIVVKKGTQQKIGFYKLIAEKIFGRQPEENQATRGTRLEKEAMEKVGEYLGKEVKEQGMWVSDFNDRIAVSPDGVISETEAVEIKCLSDALHIKAIMLNTYPKDYHEQAMQYFIVNEKLETLYFAMYRPTEYKKLELKVFELKRKDFEEEIKALREYQENILKEVDKWIIELTF